jgi:hypothetical protein
MKNNHQFIALVERQAFGFIIGIALVIYGLFIVTGGPSARGMWAALGVFMLMMQGLNLARAMRKIKRQELAQLNRQTAAPAPATAKPSQPAEKQTRPVAKPKRRT